MTKINWDSIFQKDQYKNEDKEKRAYFLIQTVEGLMMASKITKGMNPKASLSYMYDCNFQADHCPQYWALEIEFFSLLGLWIGILYWWVKQCIRFRDSLDFHHKGLMLVIAFKIITLMISFVKFFQCPPQKLQRELLVLLIRQTRTLYEVFFFFCVLLLCKGWVLLRNQLTQKEFKYLIIFMLIIYILDSFINIVALRISILSYIFYLTLIGHCVYFSYQTYKGLNFQIQLATQTRINRLLPAFQEKKRVFIRFFTVVISYFGTEALIHLIVTGWVFSIDTVFQYQLAIWDLFHQSMELVVVAFILMLYKPSMLDQFFGINVFDIHEEDNRLIPFYKSTTRDIGVDKIAIVKTPGGQLLIAEKKQNEQASPTRGDIEMVNL